jgi:ring-1,2-phenylacetyl-CoA epoxidase subunit PaaD
MVASAAAADGAESRAWAAASTVTDPELSFLTVTDLGLIRHVALGDDGVLEVGLALTYSGCPATAVIRERVATALRGAGFASTRIIDVLSPAWSSDWLTDAARHKLRVHGIAPPENAVHSPRELWHAKASIHCPHCESAATCEVSRFGSTPCKALYRCQACLEPFEYFKCI